MSRERIVSLRTVLSWITGLIIVILDGVRLRDRVLLGLQRGKERLSSTSFKTSTRTSTRKSMLSIKTI